MIAFGIIMLVVGIAMSILSILICLGNTNLIHSYHRNNVKEEDKKKYAISMGLSLLIGGLGITTSGILALIFEETINSYIYLIILFSSIFVSIIFLFIFIIKYNGKIFG